MAQAFTVAQALALGSALPPGSIILDSAGNVSASLDALSAITGLLSGIQLTSPGRPGLVATQAQATNDAAVLGLLAAGSFLLLLPITAAQAAGPPALSGSFRGYVVVDTAANVAANIGGLTNLWNLGVLAQVQLTDPGAPVLPLAAAQVAAAANVLAITTPSTIALTDGGTPTITLPATATATSIYTTVLPSITSPYTLAAGAVMRAATLASIESGVDRYTAAYTSGLPSLATPISPAPSAAGLPGGLIVSDSESALSSWIDLLQLAVAAGKVTAIEERSAGAQVESLTAAEMVNDTQAVKLFSANATFSEIIGAAQAAAPPALAAGFGSYTVQDSAANIVANLSSIDALARSGRLGRLRVASSASYLPLSAQNLSAHAGILSSLAIEAAPVIVLTDAGTPTVTIGGDLLASSNVRNGLLNAIAGRYALAVTGLVTSATAASVANEANSVLASLIAPLTVLDASANVVSNLAGLEKLALAGKLGAIELTDNGLARLSLTPAQQTADADALARIVSPFVPSNPQSSTFSGTAASLAGMLDTLNVQAQTGTLSNINVTDGGTLSISAAQAGSDFLALGLLSGNYAIVLTDGGAPAIGATQASLADLAYLHALTRIGTPFSLSVQGAIGAAAAGSLFAASLQTHLTGPVAIADTSANVQANFGSFPTNVPSIGAIQFTDGAGTLDMTVPQSQDDAGALALITSPYALALVTTVSGATAALRPGFSYLSVQDTATNIVAGLATLEPLAGSGQINDVQVTSGGPVVLAMTAAQLAAGINVLQDLTGGYSLTLTDGGAPTIALREWQINRGSVAVLNHIVGSFKTTVSDPIRPAFADYFVIDGGQALASLAPGTLQIRDTIYNFGGNAAPLQTLAMQGAIGSIDLRANIASLPLTLSQYAASSAWLPLITTPHSLSEVVSAAQLVGQSLAAGFSSFTVQDTVADIVAALPVLEPMAVNGTLAGLVPTDSAPLFRLSASTLSADADALAMQGYGAYPVVLTDAGTPTVNLSAIQLSSYNLIQNVLDTIQTSYVLAVSGYLSAYWAAQLAIDNGVALGALATPLAVSNASYTILSYLDELQTLFADGKLGSITLTDPGPVTLAIGGAQFSQDSGALGRLVGVYSINLTNASAASAAAAIANGHVSVFTVVDTAAHVLQSLDALETLAADGVLGAITLSDNGTLTVPLGQANHDAKVLAKITGTPTIVVVKPPVTNDLFNDGRSAILWRNASSGQIYEWHVNGAASLSQTSLYQDPTWRPVGTGDFFAPDASGDRGGIVWQNSQTGQSVLWRLDGAAFVSSVVLSSGLAWQIVGTGDANGDATTDIFWRNSQTGAVSEWQMANGAAMAMQTLYTDPATTVVGTGDFWGDGHSDLLIRNPVTGQVGIVRLSGFTITEQDTIFTSPSWAVVGTGDFNGDGTTDILWNNAATGQTVIWLMNGAQSLVQQPIFASTAWTPVAVGDYNGDGKSDILWHNSQTGQTFQWLMNGTTQISGANLLTDPNWAPIGNGNDSIAVETPADDFNGEGRSGIAWRNAGTGQTFLWTMNGFAQEAGASAYLGDPNWEAVASGDFNGDGHADLIFRNRLTGEVQEWQVGGVTGGGVQVTAEQTIFTDPSWKIVGTGDFNGDGKSDLVWQNANSGQIYIWLMNGFAPIAQGPALSDPAWKVVGTGAFFGPAVSQGAGPSDLLLHDAQTGETDIARMNGTQIVARQAIFTDPDWIAVATGDFNGDGRTDIIWRNGLTGQVSEWQMNGFTQLASQVIFTDPDSRVVAAGDYNGDGHADLLTQNVFTGAVTERQFNGFTPVAQQVIFTDPSWSPDGGRRPVAPTDLYGAGRSDIIWHNSATGEVYLWQQDGAASRAEISLSTDPNLLVVGRGDFFGTGQAALLFDNATTGEITLRQMNGPSVVGTTSLVTNPALQVVGTGVDADGTGHVYVRVAGTGEVQDWHLSGATVTGKVSLYTDPNWVPVATGDFNGDGKSDIVWQNSQSGQISDWLMDGTHAISQTIIGGSPTMQVIGAGDFQGSGLSGLLVRNTVTGEVDEWWMNGATIASVHPLLTDLGSTVVAVGDYNGDGKADFLVRTASTGQVQVWLGDAGTVVSKTTIFTDTNWKPVF